MPRIKIFATICRFVIIVNKVREFFWLLILFRRGDICHGFLG